MINGLTRPQWLAPVTDQTGIVKRSVNVAGHSTSISLEKLFWDALKHIAQEKQQSINSLVTEIDSDNPDNLSSALRCYILKYYQ